MGVKRERDQEETAAVVSLSLSLSTDSSTTTTESGSPAAKRARQRRRSRAAAAAEGEFVCKTCSRAFASFQALGGHRTSHLRGRRHGLELGVGVARAIKEQQRLRRKEEEDQDKKQRHECQICGLGFEMGQALGGHMRRHREEMLTTGADRWVVDLGAVAGRGAGEPPVLLELFV